MAFQVVTLSTASLLAGNPSPRLQLKLDKSPATLKWFEDQLRSKGRSSRDCERMDVDPTVDATQRCFTGSFGEVPLREQSTRSPVIQKASIPVVRAESVSQDEELPEGDSSCMDGDESSLGTTSASSEPTLQMDCQEGGCHGSDDGEEAISPCNQEDDLVLSPTSSLKRRLSSECLGTQHKQAKLEPVGR